MLHLTTPSQKRLPMINDPTDPKEAYSSAIDILSRRDRSVKELSDKLVQKGFAESAVSEAIAKLSAKHYIDDVRMASHFLASHLSDQSLTQLKFKLMRRGISGDDIATAIAGLAEEAVDESETLRNRQACAVLDFLKKKRYDPEDPAANKILASLSRKGFSYDTIKEGLSLFEEEQNCN